MRWSNEERYLNRFENNIRRKDSDLNLTKKSNFWIEEENKFLIENYKFGNKEDLIIIDSLSELIKLDKKSENIEEN